jgi:hypothetical protein
MPYLVPLPHWPSAPDSGAFSWDNEKAPGGAAVLACLDRESWAISLPADL